MKKTAPLSFRVEPGLKESLEKLAADDNRSLSSYIELALKRQVALAMKRKGHD